MVFGPGAFGRLFRGHLRDGPDRIQASGSAMNGLDGRQRRKRRSFKSVTMNCQNDCHKRVKAYGKGVE